MKKMKKFVSLLVAMVMVLAMTTSVFAAQPASGTNAIKGSITIENAVVGQTYNIYRILELESFDNNKGAYSYTANTEWENWLKTNTEAKKYVSFNGKYVEWVGTNSDARAAEFAKLAQNQLTGKTVAGTNTPETPDTGKKTATIKFENLPLGYYLVDTSLGTLCSLNTTNVNVKMIEKNEVPPFDKLVQEDSDLSWGKDSTAQIGETVPFKTTITAKKGAQNYVVHDTMTEGLTLDQNSIVVKVGTTQLTKDTHYTVAFNQTHTDSKTNKEVTCDFHITFTKTYLDSITSDTTIVIEYNAILNDKATITEPNTNKTRLEYGDKSSTEWITTNTRTFTFDIVKTTDKNILLNGAEFELYTTLTGGTKINLVKEKDGVYRVATAAEAAVKDFKSAVIEAGKVTIKGLDSDSATNYYLEETKAPEGYNKLSARVFVDMTKSTSLVAKMHTDEETQKEVYDEGGVQVINHTGTLLPSTGGMGTTVLYIAGGILVLAAVVLLFARRRAGKEA